MDVKVLFNQTGKTNLLKKVNNFINGEFSAENKEYDGTTKAGLLDNNLTLANTISGHENVEISNIELVFDNKNVGNNKTCLL